MIEEVLEGSREGADEVLRRLERWYDSMTGGDWHHTYGVSIENIDNPGWSLRVDLVDTYLYGRDFEVISIQRSREDDWLHCRIESDTFVGHGGPGNLTELLERFLDWAERLDESR